jgi:hypothetical protein
MAEQTPSSYPPDHQLNNWKEIAAYLGKSTRAVQRWEQEFGLPVHRIPGSRVVFAFKGEIDAWRMTSEAARAQSSLENGQEPVLATATAREEDQKSQKPVRLSEPRRRLARPALAGALLAGFALAVAATFIVMPRPVNPGRESAAASASPVAAGPVMPDPSLDPGPWPTAGYNTRRTYQSHVQGPQGPVQPVRIHQASNIIHNDQLLVTSRGLVFGQPGAVVAIDPAGQVLWQRALSSHLHGVWQGPTGLTATRSGLILVSSQEWPEHVGSHRVNFYALSRDTGAPDWFRLLVPMNVAPAVGPQGSIYVVDEFGMLAAIAGDGAELWKAIVPGFTHSVIAVDASGNLYAGSDGSSFGSASLWSFTPQGAVRWSAGRGTLTVVAVDNSGRVYSADTKGNVFSFDAEGKERWSFSAGTAASMTPLAVGRSGTVYVKSSSGVFALTGEGKEMWSFRPAVEDARRDDGPILDRDENIYVSFAEVIYSLSPEGRLRWTTTVVSPKRLVLGDGVLYVVSADQAIYAIRGLGAER